MNKRQCIGLLGGTFNPIHNGHLHLAQRVSSVLGLDEIRFVPSALPPLKTTPQVSAQQRAEMVTLAIRNQPLFSVDRRELSRTGKSYTIDTLISLREELGSELSLCWLIGMDAFARLDTWHDWQKLSDYANFIVVNRPQTGQQAPSAPVQQLMQSHLTTNPTDLGHYAHGKVLLLEIQALSISSTDICAKLARHESVQGLIPDAVIAYIDEHRLYQ